VPGPFHPYNVNGPEAGEKSCLYCRNGTNPVAMVFARDLSEPVVSLIKKLDEATDKNGDCRMGSFVVFLGDREALEKNLKELARKQRLKHTVLAIDEPAGPEEYNVAAKAAVTVVLYTDVTVKANYAFRKGEMTDKDVAKVLDDLPKILPKAR
jgi:hypothetical protein